MPPIMPIRFHFHLLFEIVIPSFPISMLNLSNQSKVYFHEPASTNRCQIRYLHPHRGQPRRLSGRVWWIWHAKFGRPATRKSRGSPGLFGCHRAAGRRNWDSRPCPKQLPAKQCWQQWGQPRLMAMYDPYFAIYGVMWPRCLLTRADLADRQWIFERSRHTRSPAPVRPIIPIINEK